jgi:hypothetical protein
MDPDRDEEQEEYMANIIAGEDDITSMYLNDSGEGMEDLELRDGSGEGAEDLERRDGSGEGMEGENDGSDVGTLVITKSSEVYKLSRC